MCIQALTNLMKIYAGDLMLEFIKKLLYKQTNYNTPKKSSSGNQDKPKTPVPISYDLQKSKKYIKDVFSKCGDLVFREVNIMNDSRYNAFFIYFDNMIPEQIIQESILIKLTYTPTNYMYINDIKDYCKSVLSIEKSSIVYDMTEAIEALLDGEMILFVNGINCAFTVSIEQPPARSVEEPVTEAVIRGPREGFNESHAISLCLIRKRIKSSHLKIESLIAGKQTNTKVSIIYMDNIAHKQVIDEVRNRIKKIDIDSLISSNYIEEYIEDNPFSLFSTVFKTEKPDVVCGKVLEGRVAILADSTPVVLTVPTLFIEFFMSPDDYYLRFYVSTLLRWIRILAFIMSISLPGIFVSLVSYHQELLPTNLMISIMRARATIPFPPMFEAFFMLLTYLVLQEADIRMPKTMGQAVSVVGGLVLGQAAISAGIVSAHMIIVVAFSAVCALALPTPELQASLAYIRFGILLLGGIGGMVGVTCGLILLFMHIISLRSFGAPYFAPVAPLIRKELKDTFIRFPLWSMRKRPKTITWRESKRRASRPKTQPITEENKQSNGSTKKRE